MPDGTFTASQLTDAPEVTWFQNHTGPLTKSVRLGDDGKLVKGTNGNMWYGIARRQPAPTAHDLAALLADMQSHEAIAIGMLRPDLSAEVTIGTPNNGLGITRSKITGNFYFAEGRQGWALADVDFKGMPGEVEDRIEAAGGVLAALATAVPALANVERVERASTSAGIFRRDTGDRFPGSGGLHIYLRVKDSSDIDRFTRTLHARLWLAGFGWHIVGAAGQLLDRSLIDWSVGSPERLAFEGAPVLGDDLAQDIEARWPLAYDGDVLDTRAACPDLNAEEMARLHELQQQSAKVLAPHSAKAKEAFVDQHAARVAERHPGISQDTARKIAEQHSNGTLSPEVELPFDDPDLDGCTVADVLSDPARFDGASMSDPIEGVEYGTCKARLYVNDDGSIVINSFAHGGAKYWLRDKLASSLHTEAAAEHVRQMMETAAKATAPFDPAALATDDAKTFKEHLIDIREAAGQSGGPRYDPPPDMPLFMSAAELANYAFPAEEDVWHELIPRQLVTLLYGDGKTGKTMLCCHLAVAMASGRSDLFFHRVAKLPVVMVLCEDAYKRVRPAMEDICCHFGVKFEELPITFCCRPADPVMAIIGNEGQLSNELTLFTRQLCERIATIGECLVVLDTVSDIAELNENLRLPPNTLCKKVLQPICDVFGATIIVNCHPSEAQIRSGRMTSGTTAWKNAVRNVLTLTKDANEVRKLERRYSNYGGAEPIHLSMAGPVLTTTAPPPRANDANGKDAELALLRLHLTQAGALSWETGLNDDRLIERYEGPEPKPSDLVASADWKTRAKKRRKFLLNKRRSTAWRKFGDERCFLAGDKLWWRWFLPPGDIAAADDDGGGDE